MAFGVKYRSIFKDKFSDQTHQIDLEFDDYSGSITTLRPINQVFQINYDDDKWVVGSECLLHIIVNNNDISNFDSDLFNSVYQEVKIKIYVDSVLEWVGWFKPENTKREVYYPEVEYVLSGTDGIKDLKKVDYDGFYGTGTQSALEILRNALNFLNITDIDFLVQCGIYEDLLMTPDQNVFEKVEIDNRRFYKETDGEFKPFKCYDVIENIVKPFYCKFYQSGAYWKIVNGQEYVEVNESTYQSEARVYSYGSLESDSAAVSFDSFLDSADNIISPYGRVVNIDSGYLRPASNKWELSKQQPLRQLRLKFENKNLGGNLLTNGDFLDTDGWTNGTGLFEWEIFALNGNGQLSLTESPNGDPNSSKYFISDVFTITGVDSAESLSDVEGYLLYVIDLELVGITYVTGDINSTPVYLQVTIIDPDGGSSVTGNIIIQEGRALYVTPFPTKFPINEVGDYQIKVQYNPNSGADISAIGLKVYGVEVINSAAVDQVLTTDIIYLDRPAIKAYDEEEETILLADSLQLTDIGALKINGELTKSWSRFFAVSSSPQIEDSLLLYFPFDGDFENESGKAFTTQNFGVTLVADKDGTPSSAGAFNGVDQDIYILDDDGLDTGYITVAAWIYDSSSSGEQGIVSRGSAFSFNIAEGDIYLRFKLQGDSNSYQAKADALFTNIAKNTWTHVAATWDGKQVKFYKNGSFLISVLVVKSTSPFETASGPLANGGDAHVGQGLFGGGYWNGRLDEIRVYSRVLSTSEISDLYSGGSGASIPDLTEKLPLTYLFSQQYLNDRKDYYDILDFEIFDRNNNIEYDSIISLDGKYYRFGNYSKNYYSKLISGDLIQVDYQDIGFTRQVQSLSSVDGTTTRTPVGTSGPSFQPIYDALGLKADKNGGDNQMFYYPADTDSTSIFIALLSNGRLLLRPALDKIVELINELIETKVDEDGGDAEMLYYPEDDDNVSGFFSGLLTGGAATIRNALDRIVSYVKSISPDSGFSGFDINIDDVNTYDLNIAANTSGNNAPTGWYLTAIPNLRPVMYIDGVLVIYGDGVKTEDWYFGTEDSLNNITAVAFADLTGNEQVYWNGTINGNRSQSITFGDLKTWHSVTFLHCGITTNTPSWDSVLPSTPVSASASISDSLTDDEFILSLNPWAYLKFDEVSIESEAASDNQLAIDETSNGNDFTLVNNPSLEQTPLINDGGFSIGVVELDSNAIYRNINHNPGTGLIAVYTVVSIDNGGGDDAVFGCASDSSNTPVIWLTKTGLNLRIFVRTNTGSILINVDSGFEFFSTGTHRVFFVFDGANGEYELYIDDFGSAPVASGTFTANQNINVNNVTMASIRRLGSIENTVTGFVDSSIVWMGTAPNLIDIQEIDSRFGF